MQVVIVGLLAWALFRERLSRSALLAIPVAMLGIVLISGAFENGAYGDNPALGALYGVLTGLAYSGFLLALRRSSDPRRVAGPLFEATLASMVFVVPIGLVLGNLDCGAAARGDPLADRARADLPGGRLAADLDLAGAAPRRRSRPSC